LIKCRRHKADEEHVNVFKRKGLRQTLRVLGLMGQSWVKVRPSAKSKDRNYLALDMLQETMTSARE